MTANQVKALEAQEAKRHNLAQEEQAMTNYRLDKAVKEQELVHDAYRVAAEKARDTTQSVKNIADSFKAIMTPFSLF